jgi:hypothetical protein
MELKIAKCVKNRQMHGIITAVMTLEQWQQYEATCEKRKLVPVASPLKAWSADSLDE